MERVSGLEPPAACGQSQLLRGQLDGLKLEVITASDVKGSTLCCTPSGARESGPRLLASHVCVGSSTHADHRGMNPDHFVLTKEGGLIVYATRTKTTGTEPCLEKPTFTTVTGCA